MEEVKVKKKRRIKRSFLFGLSLGLIIIISIFKIPDFIKTTKLENLGFDSTAIKAIKSKKLVKKILENEYYSDYLNAEISKDGFKKDYLELYVYEEVLTDDDFRLFDKLVAKGYSKEDSFHIFKELNFKETTPLLVFNKLDNINNYISDCLSNRTTNTGNNLILSNNYLEEYKDVKQALSYDTNEVLVTKNYTLNEYVPSKLVPLTTQYASDDTHLVNDAYNAFIKMVDVMDSQDLSIYALSGYRSYDEQVNLYNAYPSSEEADQNIARPGHSEAQTGLSVTVVDSNHESLSNFKNTPECAYLKDNAHRFGFIVRYPENRQSVTGYEYTPYQLRYIGIEKATAVYESGLSYEEYYFLYID